MAHLLVGWAPRLLAPLVVRLCGVRSLQPLVHVVFYDALASYFTADTPWHFMNYGFESQHFRENPLPLQPQDDSDRLCIQLYDRLLSPLSVAGLQVLEVGCGRGGGAAYVRRYLRPGRMVGVDISHKALRICSANHRDRNLHFLNGRAEQLPFGDATFDVVINIESSHAYTSMELFLNEVRRILRPGGFLVFADMRWTLPGNRSRTSTGLDLLKRNLHTSGLTVVHEGDISTEVLQARTVDDLPRRALIRQQVPRVLRSAFAEFAALPGTVIYRHFQQGAIVYWNALLRKPAELGAAESTCG